LLQVVIKNSQASQKSHKKKENKKLLLCRSWCCVKTSSNKLHAHT